MLFLLKPEDISILFGILGYDRNTFGICGKH